MRFGRKTSSSDTNEDKVKDNVQKKDQGRTENAHSDNNKGSAEHCGEKSKQTEGVDKITKSELDKLVGIVSDLEEKAKKTEQEKDSALKMLADEKNFSAALKERCKEDAKKELKKLAIAIVDATEPLVIGLSMLKSKKDESGKAEDSASNQDDVLTKGVEMTLKNIEQELLQFGIKRFSPVGEEFDYAKHEVIMQEESDLPKGTITKVVKAGVIMDEKVIRCATVITSKGSNES